MVRAFFILLTAFFSLGPAVLVLFGAPIVEPRQPDALLSATLNYAARKNLEYVSLFFTGFTLCVLFLAITHLAVPSTVRGLLIGNIILGGVIFWVALHDYRSASDHELYAPTTQWTNMLISMGITLFGLVIVYASTNEKDPSPLEASTGGEQPLRADDV